MTAGGDRTFRAITRGNVKVFAPSSAAGVNALGRSWPAAVCDRRRRVLQALGPDAQPSAHQVLKSSAGK